jgi:hypothetical protein
MTHFLVGGLRGQDCKELDEPIYAHLEVGGVLVQLRARRNTGKSTQ